MPFENRLVKKLVDLSVREPPCGGLSEPSGPSLSAWGASVLVDIVSAMVVVGMREIVSG